VGNVRGAGKATTGVEATGPTVVIEFAPTGEVTGSFPLLAIKRCIIPLVPVCGANLRVYPFVWCPLLVAGGEGVMGPSR
jgi:hypothetical protein